MPGYVYRGNQPASQEQPPRRGRPPVEIDHGSSQGYLLEAWRGLEPCEGCRAAWTERARGPEYKDARRRASRAWRARQKAGRAA